MSTDVFSDMLVGQETVLAILGAPGTPRGKDNSWWQVALTEHRVLVVELRAPIDTQAWTVFLRQALDRHQVQMAQYPRTATTQARIAVQGFPEPIELMEIDQPDIHPHVAPFLALWGQPVLGTDQVPVHEPVFVPEEGDADRPTLLYVIGGALLFVILCCGCGTIAAAIQQLVTRALA